jgi:aspartate aminotransferase
MTTPLASPAARSAYRPSENVAQLKPSATIAVSQMAKALAAQGRDVIDLGAGEPDFATPEFIVRAAKTALDRGATRYTATEGILPLRQAIADGANALYRGAGGPVQAADVVVSTGSKQSLFNACFVLFGAGDEVLVPTPSWTSYYEMIGLARAVAVPVMGDPARGLKVTADDLARAATPRTRGVMLNSPCNPTGSVYAADEMAAILELADERGWWVISDEIYLRIAYDGPGCAVPCSALEVARSRDRLVVINGVAKAYAMTGWRIGWAVAPRAVASAMGALQSHTTSNAAAVSQHATLAALTGGEEAERAIAHMVTKFAERRAAIVEVLAGAPELPYVRPDGAFYLYADVSGAARRLADGPDVGTAFSRHLLEHHNVAAVPGSAFFTPEWVRLSFAAPLAQVVEGVRRLVAAYRELA